MAQVIVEDSLVLEGRDYDSRTVALDGRQFVNCTFTRCTLTYRGGRAPSFQGCTFEDNNFNFSGPAGNTVSFLQDLAQPDSGFQGLVALMLPGLTKQRVSAP